MTALCGYVVLGLDHGITCSEPTNHDGAHVYRSAWLADAHDKTEGMES